MLSTTLGTFARAQAANLRIRGRVDPDLRRGRMDPERPPHQATTRLEREEHGGDLRRERRDGRGARCDLQALLDQERRGPVPDTRIRHRVES